MLPAPQLPVMLSIFAQSPDQAHLKELKAEYDFLSRVFYNRRDYRHVNLFEVETSHVIETIQTYAKDLQILHFGGHADGKYLFLADQAGNGAGLAQLLKACPKLQLVVLNGCQTLDQAQDYLAMGVPAVIATTCSVADGQARQFAESLYRALANHQSLESAFEQAVGATRFRQDTSRGLELTADEDAQPWLLEVQEEGAEKIKAWVLAGQKRSVILSEGVRDLEQFFIKGNKATKYKHYLSAGVLPYYSLDAFYAERGEEDELFSERKMIQALLEDTEVEGGIISGQGGVGKTRLMLELGLMAEQQGWKVLVLNEKFKNDATFGALLEQQAGQPFLFLIDYVEECGWFHENWLDELRGDGTEELELKFLANCRNSFSYPKQDAWLDIEIDKHEAQKDYEKWVIQKILEGVVAELKVGEGKRKIAVKKPSFAVFLRYLHERSPGRPKKLGEIHDFQTWLLKRFTKTIDPKRGDISEFGDEIAWLLSFPLDEGSKKAYLSKGSAFQQTLRKLIKDGWIEESAGQWRIVQDTVLDELALAYLQSCGDIEVALVDTLIFAFQEQRVQHWLQQVQRIKKEILFVKEPRLFFKVLQKTLAKHVPKERALDLHIWKSSLLTLEEKVELGTQLPNFITDSVKQYDFIRILSTLLQNAAQQAPATKNLLQNWVSLWIASCWSKYRQQAQIHIPESRLIDAYINVFGIDEIISSFVQDFIAGPMFLEAGQVLGACLKHGIDAPENVKKYYLDYLIRYAQKQNLQRHIKTWLNSKDGINIIIEYLEICAQHNDARFVLKAWLDGSKDFDTVQPFVIQYLQNNAQQNDAQFVLKAWLDASKDFDAVRPFVLQYLQHNAQHNEASFVLKAWLDASGDFDTIRPFVLQYLQNNAQLNEPRFVLKAWLDTSKEFDTIQPFVLKYLQYNAQQNEAHFVLKAWLDASKEFDIIQPFLLQYLQTNAQQNEAQFVLKAWLDASKEFDIIQPFVLRYLQNNAQQKEAQFVLKAWLVASKDFGTVKPFVLQYLQNHTQQNKAQFVLKAWLDASKDFDTVRPFALQYLQNNAQRSEATFVLQAWLNAQGPIAFIEGFLVEYLQKNATHVRASFVLNAWLHRGQAIATIQPYLQIFLNAHATHHERIEFYQLAMQNEEYQEVVKTYIPRWIRANLDHEEVIKVWVSWVLTYGELEQARALGSQIHRYYMEGHKAEAFWEQLPEEGSPGREVIEGILPEKV